MRSVRRRRPPGPRRIVLPAEPLVDGDTALRAWRDSDLESLVVACQDPEISRWTRVPYPYGESDARAYLLQRHDTLHAGTAAPFAIVSAADRDHLLGSISLMRFAWNHARAEVGYWLAGEARGRGHATRAVRLISAWGFRSLGARADRPAGGHRQPGLTARGGALRLHPRGRSAVVSAGRRGPPGHGRVRAARPRGPRMRIIFG